MISNDEKLDDGIKVYSRDTLIVSDDETGEILEKRTGTLLQDKSVDEQR